ncbi:MAG TPA: response regulator [Bryobacteraceae bacterium]|nr:response regulator [Bryobacteraceae bacterium]
MAGKTILLMMEASTELKLIRMALVHEGYEVRTPPHAKGAGDLLNEGPPDLILADLMMTGVNGIEMVRSLKRDPRTAAIKILLMAPSGANEWWDSAMDSGCDELLSKPVETRTLIARIRDLLAPAQLPMRQVEKVKPAGLVRNNLPGLSGAEIEDFRFRFVTEGMERCRRLLNGASSAFDSVRAATYLHQWASVAGHLGFPEVGTLATSGLRILGEMPIDMNGMQEVLTALLLTFARLQDQKLRDSRRLLTAMTSGKRVALVGFSQRQADEMCLILKKLDAVTLLFDAADSPHSHAISNCDMAIIHIRRETLDSAWLQPGEPDAIPVKFVLVGTQRDLVDLHSDVRGRAADVLLDREENEELQMRLAFALADPRPLIAGPIRHQIAPTMPALRLTVSAPTVLLADDDDIVVSLTASILRNHGMSCLSANNGLDALRLIRDEQPRAVVLDVNMPGMNGLEVLAEVRREKLPTKVLFLTACQQEEDVVRAFQLGADDYVTKPFNTFELAARVKRFLQ